VITLRIEHAIHDYDQWKSAFDRFATVRQTAGVRSHVIRRPVEDPHYLLLDLEFDTADAAEAFALFLEEQVWSSPDSAPALAGVPRTRVLERRSDGVGGGRASL
jgi:hypothetical protein